MEVSTSECLFIQAFGLDRCKDCPFDYEGDPAICGGKRLWHSTLIRLDHWLGKGGQGEKDSNRLPGDGNGRMRNERGSFDFEARKSTLELILRLAFTHGRLDEADYSELLRRIREAKTSREIREIREELNKILGDRKGGVSYGR